MLEKKRRWVGCIDHGLEKNKEITYGINAGCMFRNAQGGNNRLGSTVSSSSNEASTNVLLLLFGAGGASSWRVSLGDFWQRSFSRADFTPRFILDFNDLKKPMVNGVSVYRL
jgi:hypothetical protein